HVLSPLAAYAPAVGQVVLGPCRRPRMFANELTGPNEGPPTLARWVIDPSSGKVSTDTISDRGHEFPRHDERRIGKPIRYGYTGGLGDALALGPIYKHHLVRGPPALPRAPGRMFLAPAFGPLPPAPAEGR